MIDIERLSEKFKDAGFEDVATDLTGVLTKHKDELPRSLEESQPTNPLDIARKNTEALWEMLNPLIGEYPEHGVSRTINAIARNAWDYTEQRYRSLEEIMKMTDEELLGFRNLGVKSLEIFRRGLQEADARAAQKQESQG